MSDTQDQPLLHIWAEKIKRSSFTYGFEFRSADGSVRHAFGKRVQVRLDPATLRSRPMSDAGRQELEAIEKPVTQETA